MSDEPPEATEPTDVPSYITPVSERPPDESPTPLERAVTAVRDRAGPGSLAIGGGILALLAAVRSAGRRRGRSVAAGLLGVSLLGYGLRRRRAATDDDRPDAGEQWEDADQVTFTADASVPRSKPDLDAAGDPRLADRVDETVEIDVSEASIADEPGEATGPDPEQAQPTRTAAPEPESELEDDSSADPADREETDDETEKTDAGDAEETDTGGEGTDESSGDAAEE